MQGGPSAENSHQAQHVRQFDYSERYPQAWSRLQLLGSFAEVKGGKNSSQPQSPVRESGELRDMLLTIAFSAFGMLAN
jgi:hypothetical protein